MTVRYYIINKRWQFGGKIQEKAHLRIHSTTTANPF
jgi:hypothetical protein